MMPKLVTMDQAVEIFRKYDLFPPFFCDCKMENGQYDGMICDYSHFKGYAVKYVCEVWDVKAERQVERFNVK